MSRRWLAQVSRSPIKLQSILRKVRHSQLTQTVRCFMANIVLSPDEYKSAIGNVMRGSYSLFGYGFHIMQTLYGFPVYRKDKDFVIFISCEYCGESEGLDKHSCCAKCGAPLSGTHLTMRTADGAILSSIFEALFGTPRH